VTALHGNYDPTSNLHHTCDGIVHVAIIRFDESLRLGVLWVSLCCACRLESFICTTEPASVTQIGTALHAASTCIRGSGVTLSVLPGPACSKYVLGLTLLEMLWFPLQTERYQAVYISTSFGQLFFDGFVHIIRCLHSPCRMGLAPEVSQSVQWQLCDTLFAQPLRGPCITFRMNDDWYVSALLVEVARHGTNDAVRFTCPRDHADTFLIWCLCFCCGSVVAMSQLCCGCCC
jgi:hypothetical protein